MPLQIPLPRVGRVAYCLAALLSSLAANPTTVADIATLEAKTDRWIRLESQKAQALNEWNETKVLLAQNLEILGKEIEDLESEMQILDTREQSQGVESEEAQQEITREQQRRDILLQSLDAAHQRLVRLKDAIPERLQSELEAALDKFANTRAEDVGQRARLIVSILRRMEEFNGTFTLAHSVYTLPTGEEVVVRILYCGLAGGYAVNNNATQAWRLVPALDGWQWIEKHDDAATITRLIEIYEQRRPPELVTIGAQLHDIPSFEQ